MKGNISIQLKAAFLITVFSINTVIGFVCAMGVNMGFNSKHHHGDDKEAMETAVPVNGKEHQRHDEESIHHHDVDEEATETSVHVDGKEHQHHDEETKHHHDSKEDSEKGGCCNDGVIKFQNLEKNLNQNNTPVIYAHVFATILSDFWNVNIFNCAKALAQQYKASVFHPPPTDILIAIQRFQI